MVIGTEFKVDANYLRVNITAENNLYIYQRGPVCTVPPKVIQPKILTMRT